jgi:hypothetical protein
MNDAMSKNTKLPNSLKTAINLLQFIHALTDNKWIKLFTTTTANKDYRTTAECNEIIDLIENTPVLVN